MSPVRSRSPAPIKSIRYRKTGHRAWSRSWSTFFPSLVNRLSHRQIAHIDMCLTARWRSGGADFPRSLVRSLPWRSSCIWPLSAYWDRRSPPVRLASCRRDERSGSDPLRNPPGYLFLECHRHAPQCRVQDLEGKYCYIREWPAVD